MKEYKVLTASNDNDLEDEMNNWAKYRFAFESISITMGTNGVLKTAILSREVITPIKYLPEKELVEMK